MIVKPSLLDHPKFLRLQSRLGKDSLYLLLRIWTHCEMDRRMENWSGKDAAYVEAVARWEGTPGEAFKALVEAGFVDVDAQSIRIHDWNENNGPMVSKWVNGKNGGRGGQGKARTTDPAEPNRDAVSCPVKPNSHSVSDAGKPNCDSVPLREEKRREEKGSEVEDTHAREGSGTTAFAEIPSVEEVLSFGASFRGEMATGAPGPIDPAYCRSWWERKDNSRNRGWSTILDWRRALVSSWRADFRKTFWKGGSASASTSTPAERAESVPLGIRIRELEKAAEEHIGNPESTRGTLEAKAKAKPEWLKLKKLVRELRGQLVGTEVEP